MREKNADIVGGRALALFFPEQIDELDEFLSHYRNRIATEANQIVDLSTLSTNFTYTVKEPIKVPFCHASCLCKTQVAREMQFDVKIEGNAYREETDFFDSGYFGWIYHLLYQFGQPNKSAFSDVFRRSTQ